jgi:hypothetical protein
MAGVAGPMLREKRWNGARLLAGLAVGGVAAGLVLAIPVWLIGSLLVRVIPLPGRLALLAILLVAFGAADIAGRTPHVWRQVPQGLVRILSPGTLGLVWGFDLGLLVTTQKTVSLMWASIAVTALLAPGSAAVLLVAMAISSSLVVSAWSMTTLNNIVEGRKNRRWVRNARWASGSAMLLSALGYAVLAVSG